MAKKYESEIDPDEFIRSFREEPSSLSSLNRITADTTPKQPPAQNNPSNTPDGAATDREREYMERFVWNMTYMAPQDKYITTEIDPEIEWKIRQILFCRKKGRVCSLKAFINNVLAAHLEEYADVINQLKP